MVETLLLQVLPALRDSSEEIKCVGLIHQIVRGVVRREKEAGSLQDFSDVIMEVADSESKCLSLGRRAEAILTLCEMAHSNSSKKTILAAIQHSLDENLALVKSSHVVTPGAFFMRRASRPSSGAQSRVPEDKESLTLAILETLHQFLPLSADKFQYVSGEIVSSSKKIVSQALKFFAGVAEINYGLVSKVLLPYLKENKASSASAPPETLSLLIFVREDAEVAIEWYRACAGVALASLHTQEGERFFEELASGIRDERVLVFFSIVLFLARFPWAKLEVHELAMSGGSGKMKMLPELLFRFAQTINFGSTSDNEAELACLALAELGRCRVIHQKSSDQAKPLDRNPLLSVMTRLLPWQDNSSNSLAISQGLSKVLIWTADEPGGSGNDASDWYLLSRLKSIVFQANREAHCSVMDAFLAKAKLCPTLVPALLEYAMFRLVLDAEHASVFKMELVWNMCISRFEIEPKFRLHVLRHLLSCLDFANAGKCGDCSTLWVLHSYKYLGDHAREIIGERSELVVSPPSPIITDPILRCITARLIFSINLSPFPVRLECLRVLMKIALIFGEPVRIVAFETLSRLAEIKTNDSGCLGIRNVAQDYLTLLDGLYYHKRSSLSEDELIKRIRDEFDEELEGLDSPPRFRQGMRSNEIQANDRRSISLSENLL